MPKTGRIVNKKDLAAIFGISTQAIDGWLTRGCPYIEKGAPLVGYKFDTAAVADWRSQAAVAEAITSQPASESGNAEGRLSEAQATLAELKLSRELGQLVTLEDVERIWNRLTTSCRARLLAVPTKTAAAARSAETNELARGIIEAAITEALDELSNAGIDEASGDEIAVESGGETDRGPEAAPEADTKPVGRRKKKTKRRGKR